MYSICDFLLVNFILVTCSAVCACVCDSFMGFSLLFFDFFFFFRKNRRLFELSSLHLQIQELNHKTNHTHTFLCLNLRSILHNLK